MSESRIAATNRRSWNDLIRTRVEDYLQRHRLSLNAFAGLTGVRQSVLHRFLSGEQDNIRLDTAEKLGVYLGLELRHIGEREVPRPGHSA
jgi:hypothetical protein